MLLFLFFLAALFVGMELVGLTDLTGVSGKIWTEERPTPMDRVLSGGIAFGSAALLAGFAVKGFFFRPEKRRRYPSTLGELDQYTGFLRRK